MNGSKNGFGLGLAFAAMAALTAFAAPDVRFVEEARPELGAVRTWAEISTGAEEEDVLDGIDFTFDPEPVGPDGGWSMPAHWPTWIDYMSNYVEGCTFRRTGGAPLRFIADYRQSHWCEGTGSRNLLVRDCLFEDCAVLDGAAPQISAMCVTPAGWDVGAPPKGFVGGDARIENNRFVRPSGPVVDMPCGSVSVQSSCTRAGFEIANSSSQNQ